GGWRGRVGPDGYSGVTTPDQVEGNIAQAVAVFPSLTDAELLEADASRRETCAKDQIPVIDRVGAANVFVATGWTGHGFAIAPAVAELLADWMAGGPTPDLLRPFTLSRFGGVQA